MPRKILPVASAGIVIFLGSAVGCFRYNPQDLPGYDSGSDPSSDPMEIDFHLEADLAVEERTGDWMLEDEEVPMTEETEVTDGIKDQFPDFDGELSAMCGNGMVEPPDEECDGEPDEPCTSECSTEGVRRCVDCHWICSPPVDDDCNGSDEDCDTLPDDDYVPRFNCGAGVCERTSFCSEGIEDCLPGDPTGDDTDCNGNDEDCNGIADDHYLPTTCGVGACRRNSECIGGGESCNPGTPTGGDNDCDGIDNDCDGACDEHYTTSITCGLGPCTRYYQCSCGNESCVPGPPTSPLDTTCNNSDDDCDGNVDDDYIPYACGFGVCQRQSICSGGIVSCTPGSPTGDDSNCNALDEDCDGTADEHYVPYTCGVGACQRNSVCVGGTESCTPGPPAPAEICGNSIDDDCDNLVDSSDPECSGGCTPAITISAPGGRYTTSLRPHYHQGSCGGAGAEAYFTFTLTEASDVFLTTHQTGTINTVLYVRQGSCTGTQVTCNADADGLQTSRIQLTSLSADTYYVIADTISGVSSGDVTLDAYISAPGAASDRCGNPTFITTGTTTLTGNIIGYTNDYANVVNPPCSFPAAREDRVYYFYLPTAGNVTFDGCANDPYRFDQIIYIRSVCSD